MAGKASAGELESCPRCRVGVLYVTRDEEDSQGRQCFHCGYGDSVLKEGYEVTAPGEPITKATGKSSKAKADVGTSEGEG